jgi:hypothetical protein
MRKKSEKTTGGDTIKMRLKVDPTQGVAALVASIVPQKGYVFEKLQRKGNSAIVTYRKVRDD